MIRNRRKIRRKKKKQTEKNEKPYAQKLIPIIIFAIVSYTIADFILQYKFQTEISATLTTCWFSFWTIELINLAYIKVKKKSSLQDALGYVDESDINNEYVDNSSISPDLDEIDIDGKE